MCNREGARLEGDDITRQLIRVRQPTWNHLNMTVEGFEIVIYWEHWLRKPATVPCGFHESRSFNPRSCEAPCLRAQRSHEKVRVKEPRKVLLGAEKDPKKGRTATSRRSRDPTLEASYRRGFVHKPSQSHCVGQQTSGEPSVSGTAQGSPLGRGGSADTGRPRPRCRTPLYWKNTEVEAAVRNGYVAACCPCR